MNQVLIHTDNQQVQIPFKRIGVDERDRFGADAYQRETVTKYVHRKG